MTMIAHVTGVHSSRESTPSEHGMARYDVGVVRRGSFLRRCANVGQRSGAARLHCGAAHAYNHTDRFMPRPRYQGPFLLVVNLDKGVPAPRSRVSGM